MSDSSYDILINGIAAAKANSKAEARYFLEWLLRDQTATDEEKLQARHWLAQIADDQKEKRAQLEEIIAYNPMDPEARRMLAILDGKLNPADIVDPDRLPDLPEPVAQSIETRRFVCPNCGGRMHYAAVDSSLACEYCGRRQSVVAALDSGIMDEQNFTAALATAKGHSNPTSSTVILCGGCGAAFSFAPELISKTCPHCGTPYVIQQKETRDLIPPEAIVPFVISREQAQLTVLDWYRRNGFKILSVDTLPNGMYLPAWTFDLGGVVDWTCLIEVNDKWSPYSGSVLADEKDILISATHTLSAQLIHEIESFPLDHLMPFSVGYLANYSAETYQISVSDASIVARSRAFARSQPLIQAGILKKHRNLQFSTLKLVVESFKLVLLPLWITRYHFLDKWYTVIVNGQTGHVRGEKPRRGMSSWLANLLDGQG